MELVTYIENYSTTKIPPFKHPAKVKFTHIKFINMTNNDEALDQFYSPNVSIPDKIILSSRLLSA